MSDTATDVFEIEIGEDVVACSDPETGETGTRRVYFLAARRVGSTRYWSDFVHGHLFRWPEEAAALRDRIVAAWGERPEGRRFRGNRLWTPNTRPDPLASLAPFGEEWQREEAERRGG